MIDKVRAYIHRHDLLRAGDRVAVAVSGGADSVALLRALCELRRELGIVVSVAHFHHGIRGREADADEGFVREVAGQLGLDAHAGAGNAPAHARDRRLSLETAARELRHQWFADLLARNLADKIATAHTLDDQAETVLMRLLRGAGNRGLAAIFPVRYDKRLVRPLLEISRREIEAYLAGLGQTWREDSSNRDLSHTRNRVRHELLPMLERDFNPAIRGTLADLAEIARVEGEYWNGEASTLLARMVRPGLPSRSGRKATGEAAHTVALALEVFQELPLALQRQVLYKVGEQLGIALEFKHIQEIAGLIAGRPGRRLILPGGVTAVRSFRELRLGVDEDGPIGPDYHYDLAIPGEVEVAEIGLVIRARLLPAGESAPEGYNEGAILDRSLLAPRLTVRNWRPGDRFRPAKTRTPKKLKELLQAGRLGQQLSLVQRKAWPVVESAGEIVWVRGFASPTAFTLVSAADRDAVLIEEVQIHSGTR